MPVPKGYKRKYPNVGTMGRIRGLAAYREQHMKKQESRLSERPPATEWE